MKWLLILTALVIGSGLQSLAPAAGMPGMYGPYDYRREASGTSWQPDSTPMEGFMVMDQGWMSMAHGLASFNFTHQAGPRGAEQGYSGNMFMFMAYGPAGPGTLGLRAMATLEPMMGPQGYALLLQTGETADGLSPLVDRQHPHDLFMELALSYALIPSEDTSLFFYAGLPGEPALGPPAFMHRFSGQDIPEAPITHHWMDSTHITYGVATAGLCWRDFKLEGSLYNGRESDENRWDIETPRFDSVSARLSWNPGSDLSLQASAGDIHSPEALHPSSDIRRYSASLISNVTWGEFLWQRTLGWGMNSNGTLDLQAFLLETALKAGDEHTVFMRAEFVDKDELLGNQVFTVEKVTAGYVRDFRLGDHLQMGLGGLGSLSLVPRGLEPAYGGDLFSWTLFTRLKLG